MITRTLKGLRTALVAVAALGSWMGANAQNTTAGTSIDNRATVNYTVGGLAQAPIESSPTGNVTPGVGAGVDTSFLVDNKVDLTVTQLSGSVVVTPGVTNAVLAFTVANAGNSPQGYQLTLTEEVGTTVFGNLDNADFGGGNLIVRVDEGNGIYDGTEAATAIDTLNPSQSITVFVVSPLVPLTLINGNYANVNLQAQTAEPGTNGATILAESAGPNLPSSVEVLFADALPNRDGMADDSGQFAVVTAGLTISKTQTVLDDPFASASPRSIPGANVEYLVTIENTSTTTAADGVSLNDPIPANTSLRADQYGGTGDVAIAGGLAATCNADANDADADGCGITAGALTVSAAVIGNIAAGATVTVAFQVTIL